jgi:hypothetical protein
MTGGGGGDTNEKLHNCINQEVQLLDQADRYVSMDLNLVSNLTN